MRLAAKLMLVFLAVVVLMTAVGSYFSVRRGFAQFRQRQEQMTRDTAAAVDKQLAEAWRQGGPDGLLAAMDQLRLSNSSHRIRWVWFEQEDVTGGKTQTAVVEHMTFDRGNVVSTTVTDPGGRRQLQTYHPIDLDGEAHGGLEVTGSLDAYDALTRDAIQNALVSIGVIALSSLGLVYFAGVNWVARPLDRLIAKTQRIARGDFTQPLSVKGHDELSQLARALNDMSDQLAVQQRRIRDETAGRLATLEQLRHADRLKTVGRLAAGLAHELGTPFNVVSGRAGLIASGKLSAAEVTASAETIKAEADRVTTIIRQLLDFARPGKSHRMPVDIRELLQQTVHLIAPIAEKHQVRIGITSVSGRSLSADRGQLQQVLTNILVNAVQSMPKGGAVTATVKECDARPPDNEAAPQQRYLAIAIRDQGQGISAADRDQIFEPFFTTKEVGEGTGLGLSIAYGIVQEHGGWIDVESKPGGGSCFTVFLPQGVDAT